jgi:hypothetical protein
MPIPRILLVAAVALLVMVGMLWAMDVNYAAWLGAWVAPNNQYSAGIAIMVILGVALAWFYTRYVGEKFPGPGIARGMAFAAVLAAFAIWALPPILSGIASTVGNTQVVFQGRGLTNDELRYDQSTHETRVEPCPRIGNVEPPLRFMTENHDWAPADAWKGRVLPFGVAFLFWGVFVGAFLSEKQKD